MATWIDCPACGSHAMRGPGGEAWCAQPDCECRCAVAIRVVREERQRDGAAPPASQRWGPLCHACEASRTGLPSPPQ